MVEESWEGSGSGEKRKQHWCWGQGNFDPSVSKCQGRLGVAEGVLVSEGQEWTDGGHVLSIFPEMEQLFPTMEQLHGTVQKEQS